jgi:hypothetical protein
MRVWVCLTSRALAGLNVLYFPRRVKWRFRRQARGQTQKAGILWENSAHFTGWSF